MPFIPDVADDDPIEADYHNALRDATVPVGAVLAFAGAAAPTGFLLCDGSTASRSVYADLFDVIGTAFGAGDLTTTFNVPDLRARVPLGYKAADPDAGTLGGVGGEAAHTLLLAELPSHDHGGATGGQSATHNHDDAGHTHQLGGLGSTDFAGKYGASTECLVDKTIADGIDADLDADGVTFTNLDNDYADIGDASGDHTHTIAAAGGGDPLALLPPFVTLNYIIKT